MDNFRRVLVESNPFALYVTLSAGIFVNSLLGTIDFAYPDNPIILRGFTISGIDKNGNNSRIAFYEINEEVTSNMLTETIVNVPNNHPMYDFYKSISYKISKRSNKYVISYSFNLPSNNKFESFSYYTSGDSITFDNSGKIFSTSTIILNN